MLDCGPAARGPGRSPTRAPGQPPARPGGAAGPGGPPGRLRRDAGHRAGQDQQVQPERPVLDVVVVEAGPVADGGVPVQPVHLGPSGQPGRHPVPAGVAGDGRGELAGEVRPFRARPGQRHVPAQHAGQLGQLVDVGHAEEPAEPVAAPGGRRPAGVRVTVLAERAQLDDLRLPPRPDDADLPEQRRAAQLPPDGQAGRGEQRRGQDQQRGCRRRVEGPLGQAAGLERAGAAQRDQRHAPDLVQAPAGHRRPKPRQPRQHAHIGSQLTRPAQRPGQVRRTGSGGHAGAGGHTGTGGRAGAGGSIKAGGHIEAGVSSRHDDPADALPGHHGGQVRGAAQHPQRPAGRGAAGGRSEATGATGAIHDASRRDRVRYESPHPQAQLGMLAEQPGQFPAVRACSSQQGGLGQPSAPARRAQRGAAGHPHREQRRRGSQDQAEHRPGRDGRQQHDAGQQRRRGDPARLVGDAQADPQPVQSAAGQGQEHHRQVSRKQPVPWPSTAGPAATQPAATQPAAGGPAGQRSRGGHGTQREPVGQRQTGRGHRAPGGPRRGRHPRGTVPAGPGRLSHPGRRPGPGQPGQVARHAHRLAPTAAWAGPGARGQPPAHRAGRVVCAVHEAHHRAERRGDSRPDHVQPRGGGLVVAVHDRGAGHGAQPGGQLSADERQPAQVRPVPGGRDDVVRGQLGAPAVPADQFQPHPVRGRLGPFQVVAGQDRELPLDPAAQPAGARRAERGARPLHPGGRGQVPEQPGPPRVEPGAPAGPEAGLRLAQPLP